MEDRYKTLRTLSIWKIFYYNCARIAKSVLYHLKKFCNTVGKSIILQVLNFNLNLSRILTTVFFDLRYIDASTTYQTRWRIWIGQTWGWRGRLNIVEISRTWTTICRIELVGLAWWPRSWPVCFSISVFRFWKKITIIIIFFKSDLTVFGSILALDNVFFG